METLLIVSMVIFVAAVLIISWLEKKQNTEEKILILREYTMGIEAVADSIGKTVRNSLGFDKIGGEVSVPETQTPDDGGLKEVGQAYSYPDHEIIDGMEEMIEEARQAGWMQTDNQSPTLIQDQPSQKNDPQDDPLT